MTTHSTTKAPGCYKEILAQPVGAVFVSDLYPDKWVIRTSDTELPKFRLINRSMNVGAVLLFAFEFINHPNENQDLYSPQHPQAPR